MTTRINARLSPELARKVDAMRKRTGQSTTELVKASLESYFVVLTKDERPATLLSALIGCAEGPKDLSATYKEQMQQTLQRKHRS